MFVELVLYLDWINVYFVYFFVHDFSFVFDFAFDLIGCDLHIALHVIHVFVYLLGDFVFRFNLLYFLFCYDFIISLSIPQQNVYT